MSVPIQAAFEAESPGGSRLVTEAEALCGALCDMGVSPAVNLDTGAIYVQVFRDQEFKLGALDLLAVVADRAFENARFCEDMIDAVSSLGEFLSAAPGVNADLKTAPAADVIQALADAGLLIRHHYERNDEQTPMLSFMPLPGHPVRPNAHMLMVLALSRFHLEPDFAVAVTRAVVDAGRSQHNA